MPDIQTIACGGRTAAYHVFGQGRIELVIEMGLGAVMGEWWHIAQALSARYTVLLYQRAGCENGPRTPANIARELGELLDALSCREPVLLVAHSQGGLYAQQFARQYPSRVKGLVLLDPLTAEDDRFRALLTPEEFKKSGVDKTAGLALGRTLARLHLGFAVKALMKKAPPLYYYDGFSAQARACILDAYARPAYYDTALEEYGQAHREENLSALRSPEGFPAVPLALITHSSALAEQETMQFGGASPALAEKIEGIWQELMKRCLTFTPNAHFLSAERSTHYIHLTQPELIDRALALVDPRP